MSPEDREGFSNNDPEPGDPDYEEQREMAPDGLRLTDTGNAQRFINLSKGRVRYVHQWGRWIVYNKGRWNVDANDALVTEMAKAVSVGLMKMIPEAHGKAEQEQIFRAGVRTQMRPALVALVSLARAIPGVIVQHEDLDADPYILNCRNGTVDLRTGELRRHNPADLCTKQCPVDYDPDATAPLWEKCLKTWQPDDDVREYLQREMGAGACGKQTETLSIHHGFGGNGKSKFFGAVQHALADYSVEPHKSLLVNSKHEQHATVVTSLFRIRLAVASETSDRDRLNEEQVKNLTGNDRLRARRMREDEWSFDPTHTLMIVSNHLPTIRGTDEAIWRRVRLIPWDVTIPTAERDEDLGEKLQVEEPGILRWTVEGAVRYLKEGIGAPEKILARTATFRGDQDTVSKFIADSGIVFSPGEEVPTSTLAELHEAWCADAGIGKQSIGGEWMRVAVELKRMGGASKRRHSGRCWAGISILEGKTKTAGKDPQPLKSVSGVTGVPVGSHVRPISGVTGDPDAPDTRASESNGHGPPPLTDDDFAHLFADGD